MDQKSHWEEVYGTKAPDAVSWYRPHLENSLAMIERVAPDRTSALLDVGGGASTLVDDLLARGYRNIAVLDISETALDVARRRLGTAGTGVRWLAGDVTELPAAAGAQAFDIWHDRAVFHFLTSPEQRAAYVRQALRALKPGGHLIISTFGPEGPLKCSGLEVMRYDARALQAELGARFQLLESSIAMHQTPFNTTQQFLFCLFRRD